MGFYINPNNMPKEDWLNTHGTIVSTTNSKSYNPPKGHHLVCLIDNGSFCAAAICYCKTEFQDLAYGFESGHDNRQHLWFLVPDKHLISACPAVETVLR